MLCVTCYLTRVFHSKGGDVLNLITMLVVVTKVKTQHLFAGKFAEGIRLLTK